MPSQQFLKARKQGEKAQRYVFDMFKEWGLSVKETPRGYRPGYDGYVSGKLYGNYVQFACEVKYD